MFHKNGCFWKKLSFVAMALDTRGHADGADVLHVENDGEAQVCVGTDMKRMHIWRVPLQDVRELGIEAGDYRVTRKAASLFLERVNPPKPYPDWRRVVGEEVVRLYDNFHVQKGMIEEAIGRLYGLGILMSAAYLKVFEMEFSTTPWRVGLTARGVAGAVIFTCTDGLQATIMPMRISFKDALDTAITRLRDYEVSRSGTGVDIVKYELGGK
jgi:hypothetical protein